jgi:hypothetical protein
MKNQVEIWKDIVGWEGYYQVSNKSRIRSLNRKIVNSIGRTHYLKGIVLKNITPKEFYPYVCLRKNGLNIPQTVHRLVALAFIPNPENKPEVNHKDGNKHNYNIDNLEWSTKSENAIHARQNGLQVTIKGDKCVYAKLTNSKVLAIKRLYAINPKFHRTNLAKKLNVNVNTIVSIIKNRNWSHI